MRIKISLLSQRAPFELPANYNYQLTSLIYELLASSSQDFSTFLHDDGFKIAHKRFKLFTFSRLLIPKRRIEGARLIALSEHLELLISSPISEFIEHLAQGLLSRGRIKIVDHELSIEQVEVLAKPAFREEMRFTCLSPLVVSTGAKRNEKLFAKYLRHDDPQFSEAIQKNLWQKYQLVHGREPRSADLTLQFDPEYIARKKESVYRLMDYKGTKIKGIMAPFVVRGSPELIEMGYEAGLGEKNSMGFGMVEVVQSGWESNDAAAT